MNRLMTTRHLLLGLTALIFFAAGFGSGCITDFTVEQDGVFPCASQDDCTEGFTCSTTTNTCIIVDDDGEPCIDEDGDGYGANETDRRNCTFGDPDCNDDPATGANVHPNAAELCDGDDNDCDGTEDELTECTTAADCPAPPAGATEVKAACRNDTCGFIPADKTIPQDPCGNWFAQCEATSGAYSPALDAVPAECQF